MFMLSEDTFVWCKSFKLQPSVAVWMTECFKDMNVAHKVYSVMGSVAGVVEEGVGVMGTAASLVPCPDSSRQAQLPQSSVRQS